MSHDIPVLRELVVLVGLALVVVLLFQRLRIPPIIGFIATGVLVGPGGLRLIPDTELVRTLAEFGVVLLLFMVGLEFSMADLKSVGRVGLAAGVAQVAITLALVAGALLPLGMHPARALFFGMLVSLSSTAVVFKLLTDRLELNAPHGRVATGVLIVQDLIAIVFMVVTPTLGRWQHGQATAPAPPGGGLAAFGILVVVVGLLLLARRVIPWVLGRASRAGSREAFLFGVVFAALGAAYLSSWAGASLALGAFLAGLFLADSELRSQIAADILPFRDGLASVFFVAIGMSLDLRSWLDHPWIALASSFGLVAVKLLAAVAAFRIARVQRRVAIGAALTLAQIGEFSFVLAQSGTTSGLLGSVGAQAFATGAVVSLILTPFLVAWAPQLSLRIELAFMNRRARGARVVGEAEESEEAPHSKLLSDHVVVAGAGLNGQNVARVLRAVRLPHVVVDIHPDHLAPLVEAGSQALHGDVTQPLIQKHCGVARARVLVLALSDPTATRHACRIARSLSSRVFIVVRTRYVSEIDGLYALGANQVIPEEFETSIEIFTSALREFHVPPNVIDAQVTLLRQERYSLLRGRKLPGSVIEQLDVILEEGTTETILILQHSRAVGATLESLGLAGTASGPRLVAVVRRGEAITQPPPDFVLRVADTLVLTGTHAEIDRISDELG